MNWMAALIVQPKATLRDCFFFLLDRAAPLLIGGIKLLAHIDLLGAKAKKLSDSMVGSYQTCYMLT